MKIKVEEKILSRINQYFDFDGYSKIGVLTEKIIASFWMKEFKKSLKKIFY